MLQVGGATALLGDPTGKKENRMAAQNETIEKNASAIQTQLKHIFCRYSTRHDIDPGNLRLAYVPVLLLSAVHIALVFLQTHLALESDFN